MPLWRIYAHSSIFSVEQKAGLAKAITDLYTGPGAGLPAFYVDVLFIPLEEHDVWVGGVTKKNFVRISIEQIARTMANPSTEQGRLSRKGWMDLINATLKPFIADRPELEWEHHISETPRDLWRISGIDPPPPSSDAEKEWVRTNKAAPYTVKSSM